MRQSRIHGLLAKREDGKLASTTGALAVALICSCVTACGPLKGTGKPYSPSALPNVDAQSSQSGDASGSHKEGDAKGALSLSFESSILPIVKARCLPCHASEGATVQEDFQLDTHHAVGSKLGWQGTRSIGETVAESVKTSVEGGRMPPAGSAKLADGEKATLLNWVKLGALDRWTSGGKADDKPLNAGDGSTNFIQPSSANTAVDARRHFLIEFDMDAAGATSWKFGYSMEKGKLGKESSLREVFDKTTDFDFSRGLAAGEYFFYAVVSGNVQWAKGSVLNKGGGSTSGGGSGNLVTFRIPMGTGNGAWNMKNAPISLSVGDTLRIFNDDNVRHVLHTNNNSPCAHQDANTGMPGSSYDCVIAPGYSSVPADQTTSPTYDHVGGGGALWIQTVASNLIVFRIPLGTGNGAWNMQASAVMVTPGKTLRIFNDDSVNHILHTNGNMPCGHQNTATGQPGTFYDCVIAAGFNPATSRTYDHVGGGGDLFLKTQ